MNNAALTEAAKWAGELMDAEWKGRRDKENLVRYRLAKSIGVSESYLFRLQYKTREMTDVRGSVYRALLLARHAYGLAVSVGDAAYEKEKALAHARGSKIVGLADKIVGVADAVAGPENKRSVR
ncbi:hypothetical protein CO731_04882 [Aminobacter sp. MSH1]|nr:hypothetical protein CO731_04882 [Aminobacter sp. MSH1]